MKALRGQVLAAGHVLLDCDLSAQRLPYAVYGFDERGDSSLGRALRPIASVDGVDVVDRRRV